MRRHFTFFALLLLILGTSSSICAQVNVLTQHNDNARTGQNLSETILIPGKVNFMQFGKLFSIAVDGYVYAQPLYLSNVQIPGKGTHNVVYVATEHDSVYAFDADNNTGGNAAPLWHTSFINPANGITTVSSGDVSCSDLVPEIGITGTPAINRLSGTIYVLAKTKENGTFKQRLHALDVTTGAEKFGGPVEIKTTGAIQFDPLIEGQRAGLLLQGGLVFIGWASHCDNGSYHGWVMAYNAQTLKQVGVWNSTPNGGLGGVWQSGTGLAGDGANIYLATGNGTFDTNLTPPLDLGDSVVKLAQHSGKLRLVDYFTPHNENDLNNGDTDLGSGGVLLLPNQPAGSPHQHLAVQAGKEGSIYLLDRDNLGHFNPANDNQIVQPLPLTLGGMWATPAWWNNNLYFGGSGDHLKAFAFDPITGLLSASPTSHSSTFFNFPGPTPSVSAHGKTNGIVWVLQTESFGGGSSVLRAYDATDLSKELYDTQQNPSRDNPGGAVKFTVPTIANGKVYVGAVKKLSVYGLLP